jgi:solute carrier family 35 (UDP-sugar transporter), member A1/2/3
LQIVLFLIFLRLEEGSFLNLLKSLNKHIINDPKSTLRMALPPFFFILGVELLRIAGSILPLETIKANAFGIVGVAIFSILLLKRKFLLTQILAVIFIAFGLTKFSNDIIHATPYLWISSLPSLYSTENTIYGYLSIVASICCYGLCYVILESNLKASNVSLWIRGIQLNLFNVPISLFIAEHFHITTEERAGFFHNFTIIAWFFIIFVVACNMMELFVIKVADSMFRMISLAVATMLIRILQQPFSFESDSPIKTGTGLILAGTALYSVMDIIQPGEDGELSEIGTEVSSFVPISLYQTVPTVSYKVKENMDS